MTSNTKQSSEEAHREFERLIDEFAATTDMDERQVVRDHIWNEYGTSGATFISDMANFSSTSRKLGILHFLMLIYRARATVEPIIEANNGMLLKCDADNCYAFFPTTDDAIQASFDVNAEFFRQNQSLPLEDHIYLSVGIDYGDILLVGTEEFYGDPVNTSSKLGEDLAIKGETLVTERAVAQSIYKADANVERMVARVSDIEISYLRLPMTVHSGS